MTTFNSALVRSRDRDRTPFQRWQGLTACVDLFAPFGYHATLHHLSGGVVAPHPSWIERGKLDSAVDDLAAARRVTLEYAAAYAAKRRAQKAAGRRSPAPPTVLAGSWQWRGLAYCPETDLHPSEPLSIVVERVCRAVLTESVAADACLVCSASQPAGRACPRCGVLGLRTG